MKIWQQNLNKKIELGMNATKLLNTLLQHVFYTLNDCNVYNKQTIHSIEIQET